ncbi:peptidoglycan-binding protein [Amycolatopsis mongoliensis]|uniref:Peptidoglycan-binding protein n=1 Tax=Amycolatopsis mongoliensis TaxID=715475 RepID=A0A9Y2NBM9_9PSEU|nr:peptidoglycan-binding protein [Amycolatopsis sp. 4-36]WIX98666.1 peptidoglycan-binding protein [Amycolatopsis sp. 4-36]
MTISLVAAAAVVTGAGVWWFGDAPVRPTAAAPAAPGTAQVRRTDLSTSTSAAGTLGYGTTRMIRGTGAGIVTWLPATGATVDLGGQLYRVNDKPVALFFGDTPLYRKLDGPDLVGKDVKLVADNLAALGYRIGAQPRVAPSGSSSAKAGKGEAVLTQSLIDAIKRWQTAQGVEPTGVVDVGDVVVFGGPVRIGGVQAQLGDPATNPLFEVTATTKSVTVGIDAADVGSHKAGDKVTVTMPDGSTAGGAVSSVGTVAKGGNSADGSGGGSPAAQRVDLVVALDDPAQAGSLDSASVQVAFPATSRHGVLAVPVGALLAVKQGGYALQRPGGALVPVTTGLFARGMVEVGGAGVTEGMTVVTAS